ncbi:MAG: DUF72 domain-containing protein [Dehalococcoidia bacterium]|nr:DUF72 domain-containing protein [Dehalococcoidia bacterium]
MPGRILIGTASWTDKPLIESGRFYPPEAKTPEARLRHYATQFPLVEVDSTYYGLPTVENAERWVERTPPGFVFDVKAYSLFTEHPTPVARLPKALQAILPAGIVGKRSFSREDAPGEFVDLCWSTFNDALLPLHDAGRLGAIVFQFPKWVYPSRYTHHYLEEIRERLGTYRGAVEFRQARWLDAEHQEETLALLGDLELTYICVDEPQGFPSSIPPVAAVTTPGLAYVRFHGRNAETWEKRTETSSERFDYYYPPSELEEWASKVADLAMDADEVHLIMNTNNYDQGPENGRRLERVLHDRGIEVVHSVPVAAPASTPEDTGPQGKLF